MSCYDRFRGFDSGSDCSFDGCAGGVVSADVHPVDKEMTGRFKSRTLFWKCVFDEIRAEMFPIAGLFTEPRVEFFYDCVGNV